MILDLLLTSRLCEILVALEIFQNIKVKEPTLKEFSSIGELFPENSDVFMLGQPHYGAHGKVMEVVRKNELRLRISFTPPFEPDLRSAMHDTQV